LNYYTDIHIGTPPQLFRAQVDIGYTDVFVPSVRCCEDLFERRYNSSQSSTYRADNSPVFLNYAGFYTSGILSRDTMHVSGIEIQNQVFEEASEVRVVPFWDFPFESVLGLARLPMSNVASSNFTVASAFHNMVSQKLLTRNMFSLKLSQSEPRHQPGELMFSGINHDLYKGELLTLPVTNVSSNARSGSYVLASGWQARARSVSLAAGPGFSSSYYPLLNYTAAFSTLYPFIALPPEVREDILRIIGADDYAAVDCDKRSELPNLTISLGPNSFDFILTPWDYLRRDVPWYDGPKCQSVISVTEEDEEKYIILGSAFLGRFYSVFDYDEETISRKFPARIRCDSQY